MDSDQFTFEKLAGESGISNGEGWSLWGWGEESLALQSIPNTRDLVTVSPNPFNPVTTITFELQDATSVNLAVYDVRGNRITELINGWRTQGSHEVIFDASELPSGVYLYHQRAGSLDQTGKMVLLK
jgi:hypothetical protein